MSMIELFSASRLGDGNPINSLARALEARVSERRARKGINQILELEDHMLDDIGVTRADVHRVSRMPLSNDAATELHRISLARSRPYL